VIRVLGLLGAFAWIGWRFGPTLARLTGWCSWWVAWACGSQGGYGYCVAFVLLGRHSQPPHTELPAVLIVPHRHR
jgi:hypothetical protein